MSFDWGWWHGAWERHMVGYMPGRAAALDVMVDLLAHLTSPEAEIIELGAGTGDLAARLCDELPAARVTAVELDPLLAWIGQEVHGTHGGRLHWSALDLRAPDWPDRLARPVDAVASVAALHVLGAEGTIGAYRAAHRLLRAGGVLINLDWAAPQPRTPRLAAGIAALRDARNAVGARTSFTHHTEAIEADPELAALWAERRNRFGPPTNDEPPYLPAAGHVRALEEAGFDDVTTVWRDIDQAVVVAIA